MDPRFRELHRELRERGLNVSPIKPATSFVREELRRSEIYSRTVVGYQCAFMFDDNGNPGFYVQKMYR